MTSYIIAHDLGTSGNKATLYDSDGQMIASAVASYKLITCGPGAEQRADDWWDAVCQTSRKLSAMVNPKEIVAVSFSGQMMGCLCVDRDGHPLRNSLIWADMRSTKQENQLKSQIGAADFYQISGHRLSSSYSLTKLMWIKENEPDVYRHTYRMLNAKDYMIYRLTNRFVTEPSDASSTCMFDLNRLDWSDELIRIAELDRDKLPEIIPSVAIAGHVTREAAEATGLMEGTPVVCGGGDGCCAAVGTGVVREGIANCCLGTSSWISLASKKPIYDEDMTAFNFAHIVPGYIMPCGTMQTGGGALSWAANILFGGTEHIPRPLSDDIYATIGKEVEASPIGANRLLFLPYLMGERSPRWNDRAKGSFIGLTLGHTRGDMLRAVMEGVGYNLDIILDAFRNSGEQIDELVLVGGGARNACWRTILSDIFDLPLLIPSALEEATSMGAAITAGVGVGLFDDFSASDRFVRIQARQEPNSSSQAIYRDMKSLFEAAYQANLALFDQLSENK